MNFSYLSTHSLKLIFFFFEAFDLDFFLVAFDEAFFVSVVDLLSSILIPLVSLLDISSVLVSEVELFFMVEELLAIGVVVEVVSEGLFFGLFFNTKKAITITAITRSRIPKEPLFFAPHCGHIFAPL